MFDYQISENLNIQSCDIDLVSKGVSRMLLHEESIMRMFYKIGVNPLSLSRMPSKPDNTNSKQTFVGLF